MAKKEATANETLDALMDRINKKYGHRVIAPANKVRNPFFLRRPSGHMGLDIDTGGGLPAGGWSLISGPEGSGKTGLLGEYFANQQRYYGDESRLAIGTVEFPPDHFYLRKRGFMVAVPDKMIEEKNETRKFRGLPSFTKEEVKELKTQIGRVDVITGATAEETLEALLSLYATKLYTMIGLDSISVMLPDADADKDLDAAAARAALANLITKFAHKFHPLTLGLDDDTNETTLVFISQVRANNKKAEAPAHIQKYLSDWAATGAYSMKHGKLIDICVWPGKKVKEGEKDEKRQTGKVINYEIIKGKVGTHDGIRGEIDYDYEEGIDQAQSVFDTGLEVGVIFEKPGGLAVQSLATKQVLLGPLSKKGMLEKIRTDLDFQYRTRLEILAARGIECRYR